MTDFFSDPACSIPLGGESPASDPIHSLPVDTTIYMQTDTVCANLAKTTIETAVEVPDLKYPKTRAFFQKHGICPESPSLNPTSNHKVCVGNQEGGELCMNNVNNMGQFMGCMLWAPEGHVKIEEMGGRKVEVDCNEPGQCKQQ